MADLDWVYYDTVDVGTAANTEKNFFAHTEASNTLQLTNLGSANTLPATESFEVHEIHLIPTPDIATDDLYGLCEEATIEITIAGNRKLIIPALLAGSPFHYYDASTDYADTTNTNLNSLLGEPFILEKPIVIPGATPFKVKFTTGNVQAASGDSLIIALRGKLTRR